jgi:hypothetical protein
VHAVIGTYEDAALADAVVARKESLEAALSGISGFRAFYLVRSPMLTVSITLCDDEAACELSSERAAEYLREYAAQDPAPSPTIAAGDVLVQLGSVIT